MLANTHTNYNGKCKSSKLNHSMISPLRLPQMLLREGEKITIKI